ECTFYNVRSGSVIVAPRQKTAKYGYVFRNCIVDGNSAAADGNQRLGRPWHDSPKTVYIQTTMRIPIHPEGWMDMGSVPALFAEYGSRDTTGNLLDLSQRKTEYNGRDGVSGSCRTTLTKDEADKLVYENIIPGDDGWDPRRMIKLNSP
ncbi:MAG: pectin esterase, partial [Tannerella sp.]|nr:pectin esterase [Tannerella sp.]